MSIVDFCVIGFPKCGTTAIVRMLKESPTLQVHFADGMPESPFYLPGRNLVRPAVEPGKANGHKFSAYIYSPAALSAIYAENRHALLIINVRPAGEALLSWRDMHKQIATRNVMNHVATRTEEARAFYMNCSEAEYYHAYARTRLRYAEHVRNLLKAQPDANILIVTQRRLSADARGVMKHVHDRLGLTPSDAFLDGLPSGHQPRGERDIRARIDDAGVLAELAEDDAALVALMSELDPARVLRSDAGGF